MTTLQQFFTWRSLRTRLTIGVLVVVLTVLWTTVLIISQSLRRDMEASISAQQFSTISLIASAVDRSIQERIVVVESIAEKLSGKFGEAPDAAQTYLEQRDIPASIFNWGLIVTDAHGVAVASTPLKLNRRGVDFIEYPDIKTVLRDGKVLITDPLLSQHSQQPVVAIQAPIRDGAGKISGVVVGVTNLSIPNFFDSISAGRYGNTGSFFVTAPTSRRYVASSDKQRVMKIGPPPGLNPVYDRYIDGYEGSGVALSSRGVVELSSSKRIPSSGWLMQSVLPAEEAFAPIRAMQRQLILISVILTVLATLASWWWLQRQLQPLSEASELLDRMRDGRIPRQALPVRKLDEIGQLTTAFNGLQEFIVAEEARAAEHAANMRLRRIVSHVPGAVFQYRLAADGSGSFPFVSDGIKAIYGVSPEALESSSAPIRMMLHPKDEKRFFNSLHESANSLSPWRIEYRINQAEEETRWLLVKAIPEQTEDNSITWYGFIADITETKAMEAELRHALLEQKRKDTEIERYRDHLEQLVQERTAALELARADAERLAKTKSEFLANMSHEIRTPLNGVLGIAQLGLRSSTAESKAHEYFFKIINSGKLLLGIINDILDFSKMEAGMLKIESTRVELIPILAETVDLMRERAIAKGISIELHPTFNLPPACLSDPLRLRQILLNLLSNAVKFTESGKVVLEAGLYDNQLLLRVSDTGIGISESQIGIIFNSFEQGDNSTTRKYGGTGLGLAITERIVKLMGGHIEVSSVPGQGSVFEIHLPYRACATTLATTQMLAPLSLTDDTKPLQRLKILVAEDTEINQEILRENLTEDGAEVVIVEDGQQVVDCVRNSPPGCFDVVLMDIQMPTKSGYEAAREIAAIAPALPIIAQTAHALPQDRDACAAAGMIDHISKPIDPELLVQMILKYTAIRS